MSFKQVAMQNQIRRTSAWIYVACAGFILFMITFFVPVFQNRTTMDVIFIQLIYTVPGYLWFPVFIVRKITEPIDILEKIFSRSFFIMIYPIANLMMFLFPFVIYDIRGRVAEKRAGILYAFLALSVWAPLIVDVYTDSVSSINGYDVRYKDSINIGYYFWALSFACAAVAFFLKRFDTHVKREGES